MSAGKSWAVRRSSSAARSGRRATYRWPSSMRSMRGPARCSIGADSLQERLVEGEIPTRVQTQFALCRGYFIVAQRGAMRFRMPRACGAGHAMVVRTRMKLGAVVQAAEARSAASTAAMSTSLSSMSTS